MICDFQIPIHPAVVKMVLASESKEKIRSSSEDYGANIVRWNGLDDPENPFNWTFKYKWLLTITTCFISILMGLPAGAYGAANKSYSQEFNISEDRFPFLFFATTSWNVAGGFFPLLFVPLTESCGRQPAYFISYILFLLFLLPSALATNWHTHVITRFFGGGATSVALNVVGGTISDIWKGPKERSLPMSIFGMTSVIGVSFGSFIGGAIQARLHWRWIFWIQLILDAGLLPVFWLILRETRGDVVLAKRAKLLRQRNPEKQCFSKLELEKESLIRMLASSFARPTRMLATEPVVFFFTLWVSFAWGVLFLFTQSIEQTFTKNYGFSTFQNGLVQQALSVGAVIATIFNPFADRLYFRSERWNKESPGKPIPEARLYAAFPGSLLFSVGLFWYGWGSYKPASTHWTVPTLGVGCVGIGICLIYLSVVNYLADAYEKYAASALSAAAFGRNMFGAFLPLASQPMFTNLHFQWAGSLLGCIGLVLSLVPLLLLWKGEEIRRRSIFMSKCAFDDDNHEHGRAFSSSQASSGMVNPIGSTCDVKVPSNFI